MIEIKRIELLTCDYPGCRRSYRDKDIRNPKIKFCTNDGKHLLARQSIDSIGCEGGDQCDEALTEFLETNHQYLQDPRKMEFCPACRKKIIFRSELKPLE